MDPMKPYVVVDIYLGMGLPPERAVLPISEEFVRRLGGQVIDHAIPDAPDFIRAFVCTPPHVLDKTQINRKELAKHVARHVEEKINSMLGSRDTTMGYKQPRQQKDG